MKNIFLLILITLSLSCTEKDNSRNSVESYYGTWYRLNQTFDSIPVYKQENDQYLAWHSFILTKDSLYDNYPIEQSVSCIRNYRMVGDSLKVLSFTLFDFDPSADIVSAKTESGVYKYKRLKNLDSFPKAVIIEEDEDIYESPRPEEEFLRDPGQFL